MPRPQAVRAGPAIPLRAATPRLRRAGFLQGGREEIAPSGRPIARLAPQRRVGRDGRRRARPARDRRRITPPRRPLARLRFSDLIGQRGCAARGAASAARDDRFAAGAACARASHAAGSHRPAPCPA
jgi:antitoxin (DNA-binding transcriptional repressor) of toxin-antitoxin stability system